MELQAEVVGQEVGLPDSSLKQGIGWASRLGKQKNHMYHTNHRNYKIYWYLHHY